jgi:hypothetical protein
VGIAPAHPPFPPCLNFPFHPAAGSQTSNLISESLVGLEVPFTTQRAGTVTVLPPGDPAIATGPSDIIVDEVIIE